MEFSPDDFPPDERDLPMHGDAALILLACLPIVALSMLASAIKTRIFSRKGAKTQRKL